jgi:hypothetical protein
MEISGEGYPGTQIHFSSAGSPARTPERGPMFQDMSPTVGVYIFQSQDAKTFAETRSGNARPGKTGRGTRRSSFRKRKQGTRPPAWDKHPPAVHPPIRAVWPAVHPPAVPGAIVSPAAGGTGPAEGIIFGYRTRGRRV